MFKGHPKGLLAAALGNMGERFGYYIMNAVLVLFLCSKFGLGDGYGAAIYSVFYAGIYILSLVGGVIADRLRNYKGTIVAGLVVMTLGYAALSVPVAASPANSGWLLPFTCLALLLIACGNGLFKGNLQVLVGQMYDNLEAEAAHEGPEALKSAKEKRDSGFQIFYVFINIGGLAAPFVAPLLRSWWLKARGLAYQADLPALCHAYLANAASLTAEQAGNLDTYMASMGQAGADTAAFCTQYLDIFNTGIHFSFIASVAAMLISLVIFLWNKQKFPQPAAKKETGAASAQSSQKEREAMAGELRSRLYALFAVLGVAVFFWFSFHQNGTSMSLFARDFVNTSSIAPEVWQAVNPFFVIALTPVVMGLFSMLARRGKHISTPRKIAIGMGVAAVAYLFVSIYCHVAGYPSAEVFKGMETGARESLKAGPWVLIVYYFFMTVAELFISPLGLSFVSKVAPKHLLGLCQGLWLGATAVGNGILWVGSLMYNVWPVWVCWAVFFGVCLLSMGVMLGMVRWLERVTDER